CRSRRARLRATTQPNRRARVALRSAMRGAWWAFIGFALVQATADRARADEPSSPTTSNAVQVDLDRLGTELDHFAPESRRTRWTNAITALGLGAALLPSGIVLLHRTDGISRALVLGMVIGGSTELLSVPVAFFPTRMEEIRDEFASRPRLLDSEETV